MIGAVHVSAGLGLASVAFRYEDLGFKTSVMAHDVHVNRAEVSQTAVEFAPYVTKKYNVANCKALGITVPDDYVAIE